ncbi:MAG: hypothetical protein EOO81_06280 [Oxalobacteraceae bacterium]|nr:MAG: hypothetical protein EOO81_06280 [Oxalobacteraceae bacterium]
MKSAALRFRTASRMNFDRMPRHPMADHHHFRGLFPWIRSHSTGPQAGMGGILLIYQMKGLLRATLAMSLWTRHAPKASYQTALVAAMSGAVKSTTALAALSVPGRKVS